MGRGVPGADWVHTAPGKGSHRLGVRQSSGLSRDICGISPNHGLCSWTLTTLEVKIMWQADVFSIDSILIIVIFLTRGLSKP